MTAPDAGRAPAPEQQPRLRIVAGPQSLITDTAAGAGPDVPADEPGSIIGAEAFVRAQLPLRFGRIDIDADVVDDEHSHAWWRFFVHTCAAHLLPGATMELGAPTSLAPDHVVAGLVLLGDLAAATGLEPIRDGQMAGWQRTHRRTVHDLVADARAGLDRLAPEALALLLGTDPTVVVLDTRTPTDREADGVIAGSLHAPRTVLEWAVDPASGYAEALAPDAHLVVVCNEGYSSSLAARTLQELGFADASDLVGGMQAWIAAGLPTAAPMNHHGRCLLPEEVGAVEQARVGNSVSPGDSPQIRR